LLGEITAGRAGPSFTCTFPFFFFFFFFSSSFSESSEDNELSELIAAVAAFTFSGSGSALGGGGLSTLALCPSLFTYFLSFLHSYVQCPA